MNWNNVYIICLVFLGVQWEVAAQRCVFTLSVICFWSYCLMSQSRGRGWICQIRRGEQSDQCAVTVYTPETRIRTAEPPKALPTLMQHFWGKYRYRERVRLAAQRKSKHPEFWPRYLEPVKGSTDISLISLWVWIFGLLVAVTVEKGPIWNHRGQGFSTRSCMMEKRTGWDGVFEKGLQQDACHGEIYDVLARGRGRCREETDAMYRGEFCAVKHSGSSISGEVTAQLMAATARIVNSPCSTNRTVLIKVGWTSFYFPAYISTAHMWPWTTKPVLNVNFSKLRCIHHLKAE